MINFLMSLSGNQTPPIPQYKPLLLIMDGQSNNGGHGEKTDLPAYLQGEISPNAKIWYNDSIVVLNEANNNNNGQILQSTSGEPWLDSRHGSELQLAYNLIQQYPNRDIFFVKTGRGGRPLAVTNNFEDFNSTSTGELHQYLLDNVTDFLMADGRNITDFECWYSWMQGEYDCRVGNDAMANAYEANLTSKIAAIRSNLGNDNIQFIINVISSTVDRDPLLIPIVRQAQIDVANDNNGVFYQLSETWPDKGDNVHFNSEGQNLKGQGEANIIINN